MLFFFEILLFFVLGLLMGSFSSAITHRAPKGVSWWGKERSACPSCGGVLQPVDLIPVVSWCMFKGKCRQCSSDVPAFYPALELLCAGLAVLLYLVYGFSIEAMFLILALPFLVALFLIDLKHMILPNQLVFILLVIGVVRFFIFCLASVNDSFSDLLIEHLGGAIMYAALLMIIAWIVSKVLKKESLGLGDVKFFFVAGLWLGLLALPQYLILCGVFGVLMGVVLKKITKQEVFPFGPALIVSFIIILLWQGAYLS